MYAPSLTSIVLGYPGALSIPVNLAEAEGKNARTTWPAWRGQKRGQTKSILMALLAEGEKARIGFHKHGPPDGGRRRGQTKSIHMALLAEGEGPHRIL